DLGQGIRALSGRMPRAQVGIHARGGTRIVGRIPVWAADEHVRTDVPRQSVAPRPSIERVALAPSLKSVRASTTREHVLCTLSLKRVRTRTTGKCVWVAIPDE